SFGQDRRPLVLCGDGGFQMTAQALSTMAQQQIRSVVIVLDNGEYGIEQWLLDPRYFADASAPLRPYLALNRWDYAQLARAFGFKAAYTVAEAPALREALAAAKESTGPALICATLQKRNLPSQLRAG
ncbi:MAG TPA: thiamine pyrophosphate-dependent enzyme, partial [Myxococcaceae bacterium]|nr:thiamine pyrophosphate-dependent enzyme [Myxococcaceae bacterium]